MRVILLTIGAATALALGGCQKAQKTDAEGFVVDPGFEQHLQEQLLDAKPGDVITIPEGKYALTRSLSLTADGVTIKGAGMDKTVLSFAKQNSGAEGMLVTGDDFTLEDLTLQNSKGDALKINGVTKKWIRVRIEKGDYGEQGSYTLDNERWVFKDDRPVRPPALRSITFRYREDYRDVRQCLAFNDFQFTDCTEVARTEYTIFQPFQAKPEESPALYLGFNSKPPNDPLGLYFQLEEELGLGAMPVRDLAAKDRRSAGQTAPAHGLYLQWIRYRDANDQAPMPNK